MSKRPEALSIEEMEKWWGNDVLAKQLIEMAIARRDASAATYISLRDKALATNHVEFDTSGLDGQMIGEAFLKFVIEDPKVQECGAWLRFEQSDFETVFGKLLANVTATAWNFGSWNTEDDDGPAYHAAKALADRHKAFFGLFRGRTPRVIADGTTSTGEPVAIASAQWDDPEIGVDISHDGVWRDSGFSRHVVWSRVRLRRALAAQSVIRDKAAQVGATALIGEVLRLTKEVGVSGRSRQWCVDRAIGCAMP